MAVTQANDKTYCRFTRPASVEYTVTVGPTISKKVFNLAGTQHYHVFIARGEAYKGLKYFIQTFLLLMQ